jgi:flagellar motor switch protein FliM
VLDEHREPLHRVLDLKIGDTLMLECAPEAPVMLKCGAVELSHGRVGRMGYSLAVRLEKAISPAGQHAVLRIGGAK